MTEDNKEQYYDEVTGIWSDKPIGCSDPLYMIIDNDKGTAIACAPTLHEAQERQLELGVRATSYVWGAM